MYQHRAPLVAFLWPSLENIFLLLCCPSIMLCFCSVAQSCLTLWDPMDCSMPNFPVLCYLLEFAWTHVHWVSDAIQPSHPLSRLLKHLVPHASDIFYETTKFHQGNWNSLGSFWTPLLLHIPAAPCPPSLEDTALINSLWSLVGHWFINSLHLCFL